MPPHVQAKHAAWETGPSTGMHGVVQFFPIFRRGPTYNITDLFLPRSPNEAEVELLQSPQCNGRLVDGNIAEYGHASDVNSE